MAERQTRHASNHPRYISSSIEVTELTEYLQEGNDLTAASVLHISEHCDGDGDGYCLDATEIRIKSSAARASAGSGDSEDDLWFEESIRATALQVFVPFLAAGFGTVGAGLLLDMVQHWPVFQNVTELFILVPALLGLKGNLEMTMAARMSTQANLGNMDTLREQWKSASGNMALVQCQATVVSLLASLFAVMMGFITERHFELRNALMLCASSLVTASVASLVLGSVMIGVVILSRKHHINPDNVAIPVAASLGDLTTLALLAGAGSLLFGGTEDVRLYLCVVIFFLLFIPLWVLIARSNTYTSSVLWSGWIPIISAMAISSLGGSILDMTVPTFENLAVFQPVISGVAGNLVAIQTSRLSTYLHQRTKIGARPIEAGGGICLDPCSAFFGKGRNARAARVLMMMVLPGHLVFTYTISFVRPSRMAVTPVFLLVYFSSALLQVFLLLYLSRCMVYWMWARQIDPDNAAIPYLTALGDLLGIGLLALSFHLLRALGDVNAMPQQLADVEFSTEPTDAALAVDGG
ncbi:solute carrier family 41 member 1 isoform X1 [Rhipicephalus microplus]|uniref:solute carrier family 41 member 1 isoform X1 n=1 Tax=Rhipicephalus microplus TaxID=6941 RepID=UPI003F6CFC8D